jgi:hypothetical protein
VLIESEILGIKSDRRRGLRAATLAWSAAQFTLAIRNEEPFVKEVGSHFGLASGRCRSQAQWRRRHKYDNV